MAGMDNSTEVLIIILSVTLSVFLLAGIVALIKVIQILNRIKTIVEKAETVADKVEAVGEFFKQSAAPVAIAKMVANISEAVFKRKTKR